MQDNFITEPTGKQPTTSSNESSLVINQDLKSTIGWGSKSEPAEAFKV